MALRMQNERIQKWKKAAVFWSQKMQSGDGGGNPRKRQNN